MKNMQHAKTNYSKITNFIYIGTNFCCQVDFDKGLLKKGITVDINMEKERMDTPFGVALYLWLPVRDRHAPSPYQLRTGVEVLREAVKSRQKVYAHCKNGHGRAPTLVAAYFISQGRSAKDAITFISLKRPEIHLTKAQIAALGRFEKSLKKRKQR